MVYKEVIEAMLENVIDAQTGIISAAESMEMDVQQGLLDMDQAELLREYFRKVLEGYDDLIALIRKEIENEK